MVLRPDNATMPHKDDHSQTSWLYMAPARTVLSLLLFLVTAGLIVNLIRLKQLYPARKDPGVAVAVLGVFAVIGFFGAVRGGVTLDLMKRRLTRWWGPFVPVQKRHIVFGAIRVVQVGPGLRPGYPQAARARAHSYHVAVRTDQGTTVVRWGRSIDDVRRRARLISEAVGCPMEDTLASSPATLGGQ
jgi:hypothetical protein